MNPLSDKALMTFAERFMVHVGPEIKSEYWQTETNVMASLLMVAAEDFDKAADTRLRENSAMRDLFSLSCEDIADSDLRTRLDVASNGQVTSYRVSALQKDNEVLKTLLIELHSFADDNGLADLSAAIWRLLADFSNGRKIELFG
jgi:hypothetical protein